MYTQATPATSEAWGGKKGASGSGKKVGFALQGGFQVLIMVSQKKTKKNLCVCVCVCCCGFSCVQVWREVIRFDTNLPTEHAAAHYFTYQKKKNKKTVKRDNVGQPIGASQFSTKLLWGVNQEVKTLSEKKQKRMTDAIH